MLVALLCGGLFTTHPAQAGQSTEDADALQSCIMTAWPRDVMTLCTGIISDPCQETAGGASTQGMNRCLAREADAWDVVLNRLWPRLMTQAREVDAANARDRGVVTGQRCRDAPQRPARLIVYRDADCRHNYASWGLGSFRTIAHSTCRLDLTARRVVDFHARLVTDK